MNDISAAIKLLPAVAHLKPVVYKTDPTGLESWEWKCQLQPETSQAFCSNGCQDFEDLSLAIVLTCLEALGIVDNSPLDNTPEREEQILQVAQLGPLAGVPGNRINSRYCDQIQTWIVEEIVVTQDGEETNLWLTQYRDGHYVFQVV